MVKNLMAGWAMRKRAKGLSWLKEGDKAQEQWAHNHLQAKGLIDKEYTDSTHEGLLSVGAELEAMKASGLMIISGMRAAWRQVKHRAPANGRKPYSFTLPTSVKNKLDALAKSAATTETSATTVLIALIEDATDEVANQKKWLKEANEKNKTALQHQKNEVTEYKLVIAEQEKHLNQCLIELCRLEALHSGSAPETLESMIDALYKQKTDAIKSDINEVIAKVPGLQNKLRTLTRAMGRPIQANYTPKGHPETP
jgi:predicted DNA-binding protein